MAQPAAFDNESQMVILSREVAEALEVASGDWVRMAAQ
ncbi:hypothetical protein JCM19241_1659 [Vibrio ishigakensis]|uniref:Uncharacterized protein n=1 Tax=Vibrio ishigakensis TaxID=1481914 RepID=A0A0B8QSG1_9VIBR|nr:hypothetical protein JCM19241_1659 [Vibrio ishigakensis]